MFKQPFPKLQSFNTSKRQIHPLSAVFGPFLLRFLLSSWIVSVITQWKKTRRSGRLIKHLPNNGQRRRRRRGRKTLPPIIRKRYGLLCRLYGLFSQRGFHPPFFFSSPPKRLPFTMRMPSFFAFPQSRKRKHICWFRGKTGKLWRKIFKLQNVIYFSRNIKPTTFL